MGWVRTLPAAGFALSSTIGSDANVASWLAGVSTVMGAGVIVGLDGGADEERMPP